MKPLLLMSIDAQKGLMRDASSQVRNNIGIISECVKYYNPKILKIASWYERKNRRTFEKNSLHALCEEESKNAKFIPEITPKGGHSIYWYNKGLSKKAIEKNQSIILYKNAPSPFDGNIHTRSILELINPEKIIIYGANIENSIAETIKELRKTRYPTRLVYDAIFPCWEENMGSDMVLTTQQINKGNF